MTHPASISEMPQHERPLSEQFRVVAKQYAEAAGRYTFMENTRSGTLARMVKKIKAESNEKMSEKQAENEARASEGWFQFNAELARAKERMEVLRDQKKYIDMVGWEQTNANADVRTERRLSR